MSGARPLWGAIMKTAATEGPVDQAYEAMGGKAASMRRSLP